MLVEKTLVLFMLGFSLILIIVIYLLAIYLQYKLFNTKYFKNIENNNSLLLLLLMFVTFGATIFAWNKAYKKREQKRVEMFNQATLTPSNENVNNLIDYINEYGLENKPQEWNKLRGVWFAINESPNVSTQIKKQLRDFLTTKGLRITGKDKEVINNHK